MKKNRALIGAWFKHVPLHFFCPEKIKDFQPIAKIKRLSAENEKQIESTNSSSSACPTGQRSHATISHQDRRTQHTTHCQPATQPHRSPVNSQQANHNNSPDVPEPLFRGVRAKLEMISA